MPGLISIYDARSLSNAVNKTVVTEEFVMKTFFGTKEPHATDSFDLETYGWDNKLAQITSDDGEAKLVGKKNRSMKTLKVPRSFEKKVFTAHELSTYNAFGQIYYENTTDKDKRANEWVLQEVDNLKKRVFSLREFMACQAISTGAISISQDDIAIEVDFGLVTGSLASGGHKYSITTKWTATTGDPISDIREWKKYISQRTGKSPTKLILGDTATQMFLSNTKVQVYLDTNNYALGRLDLNKEQTKYGDYLGKFLGVDVYSYNQVYLDSAGTSQDMIGAKLAIMVLEDNTFFKLHTAPIYRIENNNLRSYQVEFLLEPLVNLNKTYLEWKLEQKSLPAIHNPDALIIATVVA